MMLIYEEITWPSISSESGRKVKRYYILVVETRGGNGELWWREIL